MTTRRNRPIPLGKRVPIPVNTEAVREYPARNREWLIRVNAIVVGEHLSELRKQLGGRWNSQLSVGVWESSRLLLGIVGSESNRKRLSASKGTREAQPSRVVTRISRRETVESSPMRRLGGGASVVVRGREGRPHGEGRQNVSFWAAEVFGNREGSR